ncbi:hypothetical protein T492DRAFT_856341 [Pavlovales sp. CCMP2436]|nr:hypothetical protein T492DRAFT_856341 [Pavlovales sp. CCMP2436]
MTDEPVCCKHVFSLLLTREKQPTRFGAAAIPLAASPAVPLTAPTAKPRAKAVAKEDDDLDPIPPRPKAESAKRKAAGRSILIDPLPAMLTGAFLREYAVESLRLLEDEEKAAKRARTSVSPLRVVDSAAGAAQQIHSTLAGAGSACPPPPGLPPGPGADAGASNIPPLQARHGSDAGAQQAQDAGAVGRTPAAPAPWAAPASSGGAQALPAVQSAPASATGALPDAASPVKPPAPKPAAKEESWTTCVYISQQNGHAERVIRSILEKASIVAAHTNIIAKPGSSTQFKLRFARLWKCVLDRIPRARAFVHFAYFCF